jgi:signal transduction histidine kinase
MMKSWVLMALLCFSNKMLGASQESEESLLLTSGSPGNVWSGMVYASAVVLGLYLCNRWWSRRLEKQQRQLSQLVELRTRELRANQVELRLARDEVELAKSTALLAKDAADLARENTEKANRAKTAFLANMSHQLRTPINSILGYTQILIRRLDHQPEEKMKLKTILSSGEQLLRMINDVLDLARIESGTVSSALERIELSKFIGGIVDEFRLRASQKNLRFVYRIQGELPDWIETDPLRLRQVLYNLLGNALKFTVEGGITLRVFATKELIRFEVNDTGRGIPAEDLSAIFQPF